MLVFRVVLQHGGLAVDFCKVAKVQDSGLVCTERQEALGGGVGWDGVRMTHKKNPTF